MHEIRVDVLIVGAGPSGASLACFLASYGINGLVISKGCSTSEIPKANYTNMAAFECLRDIGLEDEARRVAHPVSEFSTYHRICKSLAGEEIFRAYAFGNDPHRHGDYADASPCEIMSLPQSHLEPILIRHASRNGFPVRFNTSLLGFKQLPGAGGVESVILDRTTMLKTLVRSKYLCGADGASSMIVRDLELPLRELPSGGLSINLYVEADLTHLVKDTPGLLHVMTRPDKPQPYFGVLGMARFIKPWTEWVIVLICRPGTTRIEASTEEIMARAKELVGDDSVEMKLKNMSIWRTNECYAEQFSKGDVFCLGDSVHRHPPQNGLGSNTCIQDAFNLAWKMALVLDEVASPTLLDTFTEERQPIGKYIVGRANDTARLHKALFKTLGLTELDPQRKAQIASEFEEHSGEAEERRVAFREAVRDLDEERHALGAEMNMAYESQAICTIDETADSKVSLPTDRRERCLRHIESTYPGFRVPHAWLSTPGPAIDNPSMISTRDLCGHGRFTLLTGPGGKPTWAQAADEVHQTLRVRVLVVSVGWGQDYHDTFFQWHDKRAVRDSGAVLVRPDHVVAWRCSVVPLTSEQCHMKLLAVLKGLLGYR